MEEYHKIQTVFLRDPDTKHKTLLIGQYAKPEFEYLKDNQWIFTEKVDGTNIRVMFDGNELSYAGKTDRAQIPPRLMKALKEQFESLVDILKMMFPVGGVCFYGEGYGAKIQKGGGNYRNDNGFVLFDVWVDGWWLERHNIESIADDLSLSIVPIIGTGTLADMVDMVQVGFNSQWGDFAAEGIVAKPFIELFSRSGKRIITKLKHKDFIS